MVHCGEYSHSKRERERDLILARVVARISILKVLFRRHKWKVDVSSKLTITAREVLFDS